MGDGSTDATYDPSSDSWLPIANSPLTVSAQTVVWTGTEMIVWGGIGIDPLYPYVIGLNTGARYNPTSDTWVATSAGSSVPYGRLAHTAIWTGTEMIVWGDNRESWFLGSPVRTPAVGTFPPSTVGWRPPSATVFPSARTVHSAVWTGEEMIVWGPWRGLAQHRRALQPDDGQLGRNVDGRQRAAGAPRTRRGLDRSRDDRPGVIQRYIDRGTLRPATDSWRTMSPGPSVAAGNFGSPTYLWTGTEMIVWGGCCNHAGEGRYNPTTDSWTTISTGPGAPYASVRPFEGLDGDGDGRLGRHRPRRPRRALQPIDRQLVARCHRERAFGAGTCDRGLDRLEMVVWGGATRQRRPRELGAGTTR